MSKDESNAEESFSRNLDSPMRKIESVGEAKEISSQEDISVENSSSVSEGATVKRRKSIDKTLTTTEAEESRWTVNEEADGRVVGDKLSSAPTKLENDGSSSVSSTGDICRICHMGGFPAVVGSRPMWEWPNRGARRIESQISTLSSYAYLGPLISACKCRGTVGLVHAECLERWLTESGHARCELCGHRYTTKRVSRYGIYRSVVIWFNTVVATRQMLLDILYLIVTTPLALFSCYVCALALKMIIESGFQDIPWMIVAMLPTCSLTLVAYWGWLITLGRYISRLHGRRWRRFWRNNFVVRLVPETASFSLDRNVDESARERIDDSVATRRVDWNDDDLLFERLLDEEEDVLLRVI